MTTCHEIWPPVTVSLAGRPFVSYGDDRRRLYEAIRANPGIGHRGLRALAVLTGRRPNGRIRAALDALVAEGRVSATPDPRDGAYGYRPSPGRVEAQVGRLVGWTW
jgi:hypothetical protein